MIAKRYDDELMYSVQRCDDSSNKYKYCTKDGKLAFKKPDKDFLGVTKQNYKNVYVMNKGKGRGIILRSDLRRELLKYCKDNKIEEGYIFTSSDKKSPVNARVLSRDLKMIAGKCRGIKLGKVHPHAFRHLFAIQYLMQNGENAIAELADILGHSSLETTRIYVRTTRKMKKQNLESLSYAKRK